MTKPRGVQGLRLVCSASVDVVAGDGAPILVHSSLEATRSDFEVLFGGLFNRWHDCFVVNSFYKSYLADGTLEDSTDDLKVSYGSGSIHSIDHESGLVILHGSSLPRWAMHCGGEWWQLLILESVIPFEEISQIYFGGESYLGSGRWPSELRCVPAEWDDTFWQFFSRDRSEIEYLKNVHREDPRIELFASDIRSEYPHPSGQPLRRIWPVLDDSTEGE